MRFAPSSVVLTLAASAAALAPGAARADQVRTVDSVCDEAVDTMEKAGDGGKIVTESGRQIALADAQLITMNPLESYYAAPGHARVVLFGGDVINAEVIGGSGDGLKLRGRSLGEVEIELERIHGVLFSPASFEPARVRVFEGSHLGASAGQDVVTLATGGRTEGTIDLIDTNGVKMESKTVGEVNFELDKVESLVLTPLGPTPPLPAGPRLRVRLRDGSLVTGKLVSFTKGDKLVIDCRLGEAFEIKAREISTMTVLGGRTVYFSDLTPATVRQGFDDLDSPLYDWDPRVSWKVDRTCFGEPIRLGGKVYERGLGVHSTTELTFEVGDQNAVELRATVSLDDTAREPAQVTPGVVFQVIVDGKPRFGDGMLVGPDDDPKEIRVDVKGAKKIILLVSIADTLHSRGRAVWADAQLVRSK